MKSEEEDLSNVEFPGSFGRNPSRVMQQNIARLVDAYAMRSKMMEAHVPQRSQGKAILSPPTRFSAASNSTDGRRRHFSRQPLTRRRHPSDHE